MVSIFAAILRRKSRRQMRRVAFYKATTIPESWRRQLTK